MAKTAQIDWFDSLTKQSFSLESAKITKTTEFLPSCLRIASVYLQQCEGLVPQLDEKGCGVLAPFQKKMSLLIPPISCWPAAILQISALKVPQNRFLYLNLGS